jgi:PAS domain S-box-containing protein
MTVNPDGEQAAAGEEHTAAKMEQPGRDAAGSTLKAAPTPVRVLVLEDNPADAELMIRELRRNGFEPSWQRVESEPDYVASLASRPDVILADYRLAQIDAIRALEVLREFGLNIPFIVVSGAVGEEVAVATMRCGASDYILKDRMTRLGTAVRRTIDEAALQEQTRRAAEELRASEIRFQSFMNNSPVMARIKDADGRLLYMNSTVEQLLGIAAADCVGRMEQELWPSEVAARLLAVDQAVFSTGEPLHSLEEVLLGRGPALQLLMFRFLVYDSLGRPLLGEVSADITELMRTQKALADALAAKEVLLREQNHRVKNNLQLISSLLRMQADSVKDSATGRALQDAQTRIQCMALVHDRLNFLDGACEIAFHDYASTLAHDLFEAYGVVGGPIRLREELEPVSLDLNRAIPCGLILNELVTNSLKYAFPRGRSGEIVISLRSTEDNVSIGVADDGIGLRSGFDWRNSPSLGLQIMTILSRQLGGTVTCGTGPGTSFVITFPANAGEQS